jgi:hypothetical protein
LVYLELGGDRLNTFALVLESLRIAEGAVLALAKLLSGFVVHALVRVGPRELVRQYLREVAEAGFPWLSEPRLRSQNSTRVGAVVSAAGRAALYVLWGWSHVLRKDLGRGVVGLVAGCHRGALDAACVEVLEIPLVLNSIKLRINIEGDRRLRCFVTAYFWIGSVLLLVRLEDGALGFLVAWAFCSLRSSRNLHNQLYRQGQRRAELTFVGVVILDLLLVGGDVLLCDRLLKSRVPAHRYECVFLSYL